MLDTYKKLQAHGAIGSMMKVGPDGKTPIYDPSGEQPGTLIARPFQEFPKAVRRVRVDAEGKEQVIVLVAGSKAEELRIMSDTAELAEPRSPLERERDSLAEDLAVQQKMSGSLATQLETALARMEALSNQVEKLTSAQAKPAAPSPSAEGVGGLTKGIAGSVEARALANKK